MGKTTVNRNKKEENKLVNKPVRGGKKIVFIENQEQLNEEPKKPLVNMDDLIFFGGKWINGSDKKSDVSITKIKCGYHIIFRNNKENNFKINKLKIAVWKDKRVYFQESKDGLTLCHASKVKANKPTTCYIGVNGTIEEAKKLLAFVGDYKLKFDDDNELYYIER